MQRSHLSTYLLILLLATAQARPIPSKNLTSKEKNDTSSLYVHGEPQDWNKIIYEVDTKERNILSKALIQLYKDSIAGPTPVYFIVGPSGAGKSTSVFALQGNAVIRKKTKQWRLTSSDEDETESDTDEPDSNTGQLMLKKTIGHELAIPKVASSSYGVTEGVKIYYTGKKIKKAMAFCDTEGFLGARKVYNNTDKLIASFSPYFALKANPIAGIVLVVSSPDIMAARGKTFLTCMHFLKSYFDLAMTDKQLKTLKQSVMLLITKEEGEEQGTAKQLASIIKQAYKEYCAKKNSNHEVSSHQKLKQQQGELAQLKPFFSLFLKKDVKENELDTINLKLLDGNNLRFFYPYQPQNVRRVRDKLLRLKPLSSDYLSLQDTPVAQYFTKKIIERARAINTISHKVLKGHNQQQLQRLLQQKIHKNRLQQLSQMLQRCKEQLCRKNDNILHSEELECVYHNRHIEETPCNREEERDRKIINYKKKLDKEIKEGKGYFKDSNALKRTLNRGINLFQKSDRIYDFTYRVNQEYRYAGYLHKHFFYTGGAAIHTIKITVECTGKIVHVEPNDTFVENNFEPGWNPKQEQEERKLEAYNPKGVRKNAWHIYHETAYERDANCSVKFFSKKNILQESTWKINDNKRNIQRVDFLIKMLDIAISKPKYILKKSNFLHTKVVYKDPQELIKQKKIWQGVIDVYGNQIPKKQRLEKSPEGSMQTSKKWTHNLHAFNEEMKMINCWSQRIFKKKSTNQELITQYITNYNEVVSDKYQIAIQVDSDNDKRFFLLQQDNTNAKHSDYQPGEPRLIKDDDEQKEDDNSNNHNNDSISSSTSFSTTLTITALLSSLLAKKE